ncbi:ferredoxin [uncultured Tateyamaria sp.]|uniref:ferredoxin n=1 Tax=uncultured Tateyamaria sp. TaxID=455651 RepID=UPI00261E5971|nr:ferredoxin [uncultured Tateyamaria sp.]
MTVLAHLRSGLKPHGLFIMGVDGARVLIGTDAGWWDVFAASAEHGDGAADPVDRWSKRVLGTFATEMGAQASFPSDGPPYAPFIAWALATGRFWQSPTGMMIHDTAGLMISIRGALVFDTPFAADLHNGASPCVTCADRPCVTACPVRALSADAPYDVPACKSYLDTDAGADCMGAGCVVRRVCPVSQTFDRPAEQSAFHMAAFHK